MTDTIESILSRYIPAAAVATCTRWIISRNIHLKIAGVRSSKLGDYRPLSDGRGHRITVNHDLNPFSFLITFTHEVAHLHCFLKYGPRHDAHGKEWKDEFRQLLGHFLDRQIFPDDLSSLIRKHLQDPPSSSCHDATLSKALRKYDPSHGRQVVHLDELADGTFFRISGERSQLRFQKGPLNRTRYRCFELSTGREYLVSGIAEVEAVTL
ncbi:MAG: SprT-like domain-containing protein [Bacteroidota bacterium]